MRKKIAIIGLSGESIFMEVDNFHKDGETKQATKINIEPGGKGYNQAIACARLGLDVYYLSAVGNDTYGTYCESFMKQEGIKTYFRKKQENTAVATIITNKHGDNQVTVYRGASELLDLDDLELFKPIIKECDILLLQNEIPYNVLEEAIKYAYSYHKYIILNPAPAVYNLNNILNYINLLIPNEVEASTIYNKNINDISINNELKIIITLGSKGCLYIDKNIKKYYEAKKVKVIDTTGAGDVFCAAIASKILLEKDIDKVIDFAQTASSIHIQKQYVMKAIPSLNDVK